jgi:hypothetical protein
MSMANLCVFLAEKCSATGTEGVRSLLSLLLHGSHTSNIVQCKRVHGERGTIHVDLITFVHDLHTSAHLGVGSRFVAFGAVDDSRRASSLHGIG